MSSPRVSSLLSIVALVILVVCNLGNPLAPRDAIVDGPEGSLNLQSRFRDSVGTAIQVFDGSPVSVNESFHSLRSGPISSVFRAALSDFTSRLDNLNVETEKREVSINGFGTTGEVQYNFWSSQSNVNGRSTQVMVACRCLGRECRDAILIRPINITTRNPVTGEHDDTGKRTCIYEAVDEYFSDCHLELLRISTRQREELPRYLRKSFNYTVPEIVNEHTDWSWNAFGQRGWTKQCLDTEVEALPTFEFGAIRSEFIRFNNHTTPSGESHCRPPPNVQYFRDISEADNDQCIALYDRLAIAAAHRATQQDEISRANDESTYLRNKPPQVSDTELTLSCSASGLGLLFLWSTLRKQQKKRHVSGVHTLWLVSLLMIAYVLEALPLHTALAVELFARWWVTEFAFMDTTLVMAQTQKELHVSSLKSLLMLTAVVGDVQFKTTRVPLILGLTVIFDFLAVGIMVALVLLKLKKRREQREGRMRGLGKDEETVGTPNSSMGIWPSLSLHLPRMLGKVEKLEQEMHEKKMMKRSAIKRKRFHRRGHRGKKGKGSGAVVGSWGEFGEKRDVPSVEYDSSTQTGSTTE